MAAAVIGRLAADMIDRELHLRLVGALVMTPSETVAGWIFHAHE